MTRRLHFGSWLERWLNRRKIRKTMGILETNGFTISTVYDIEANKCRWARDMQVLEQHVIKGALTQFDILFIRKVCVDAIQAA